MKTASNRYQKIVPEKATRSYAGQESAAFLVNWLNLTEDATGRQRILDVIQGFTELASCLESTHRNRRSGKHGAIVPRAEHEKVRVLEAALKQKLEFYQTVPTAILQVFHEKGRVFGTSLRVSQRPAPGSELERNAFAPRRWNWKQDREFPGSQMSEAGASRIVFELVERDLLRKLHACRCGQYFFRKLERQRFCSDNCRQQDFQSSPEAKQKRNEYARTLYHLRKSGKVV